MSFELFHDYNNRALGFGEIPAGTIYRQGTPDELAGGVWDPRLQDYACDVGFSLGGEALPLDYQFSVPVSVGSIVEPPPSGYPRIIVHPERPDAAFVLIEAGWYRSPTGPVVPYKTVAEYVLTAPGDRMTLLKALGQVPGGLPSWLNDNMLLIGGAAALVLLLALLTSK